MKTIAVLIGSLRKGSYNRMLFKAFKEHASSELVFKDISIDLPLFNEDIEENFPPTATLLKESLEAADGVLIISPEYNRSVPGVLKNALDWASRKGTTGKNSFDGKKVATAGVTPGGLGTAPMQQHLRSVLVYFNAQVMGQPEFYLSGANDVFLENGNIQDEKTKERVQKFLDAFTTFIGM